MMGMPDIFKPRGHVWMQVQAVVTAAVCLASGGWFLLLVLVHV